MRLALVQSRRISRPHSHSVLKIVNLEGVLEGQANLMPVFPALFQTRSMTFHFGWLRAKQLSRGWINVGDKSFKNRLILRPGVAIGGNDGLLEFRPAVQDLPKIAFDERLEVLVRECA